MLFRSNVTLDIERNLTVQGGIVAANSTSGHLELAAANITTDGASVFIAKDLNVVATGGIQLNTLVDTITASSTTAGNIDINEATGLR